jgi:hypothetical protein
VNAPGREREEHAEKRHAQGTQGCEARAVHSSHCAIRCGRPMQQNCFIADAFPIQRLA